MKLFSVLDLFKKFDSEGNGEIPTEQFPDLMREAGFEMSDREAAAVIRIIDKDGDGNIDASEFLSWWREHAMQQVFLKFDADNSGELSKDEFQNVLAHLGITYTSTEHFEEIFAEVDVDQNGVVSFAELLQVFFGFTT
jgi:Ca2+-binding EF-hand superfamily protein